MGRKRFEKTGLGRRRTEFGDSVVDYTDQLTFYVDRLTELGLSVFEWQNLPATIDAAYLERSLYYKGYAFFFEDPDLGYLALSGWMGGRLDVYDNPIERQAIAANGYRYNLDRTNSVIIYNNFLKTPADARVYLYAKRLARYQSVIDVNIDAQRTPYLIQCEDDQRLTLKNLYAKVTGGEPVIYGRKALDLEAIKVFRTDAPYIADKVNLQKERTWNEALTYLGIPNVSIEKKERLIRDEVERSQGGSVASRFSRLAIRQQACAQINEMFGLNVQVDYRDEYKSADGDNLVVASKGGDNNE